ncbi:MAG: hypothetical protein WAV05_10415 [Anaerolineales bacterium]
MTSGEVECRSDHDYIGQPLAFYWQGKRLEVTEVLSQNRTPLGYSFRVLNEDFGIFELNYDTNTDQWSVDQR